MRGLGLLLLVYVALGSPQRPERTSGGGNSVCNSVQRSVEQAVGNRAAVEKCIAEQPGLQATLQQLQASAGSGGRQEGFPTILLAKAGKISEATTLRKCLAGANNQLTTAADGSQVFDVAKFQSDIVAKVVGTTSEANTKLGLNNCPVTPLANYEVFEYMKCIVTYCATGAAPTN